MLSIALHLSLLVAVTATVDWSEMEEFYDSVNRYRQVQSEAHSQTLKKSFANVTDLRDIVVEIKECLKDIKRERDHNIMTIDPLNCPEKHGLKEFTTPSDYSCSVCKMVGFTRGSTMQSCRSCEFDACMICFKKQQKAIEEFKESNSISRNAFFSEYATYDEKAWEESTSTCKLIKKLISLLTELQDSLETLSGDDDWKRQILRKNQDHLNFLKKERLKCRAATGRAAREKIWAAKRAAREKSRAARDDIWAAKRENWAARLKKLQAQRSSRGRTTRPRPSPRQTETSVRRRRLLQRLVRQSRGSFDLGGSLQAAEPGYGLEQRK